MSFLKTNKVLVKKIFLFGLISSALALSLFVFAHYQETIENTKLSYVRRIYFPALVYRIHSAFPNNATRRLALAAGVLSAPASHEYPERINSSSSIPVLVYHGIVEESSESVDGVNVLVEDFLSQMKALKEEGYNAISYGEFEQFARGEITLPEKSILITFDDGRKDSYYPVDPILKAYDYHATIFILPKYSFVGERQNYYLSKNELKTMAETGRWSIQSHSMNAHTYYSIDGNGTPSNYYANKLWLADKQRLESDAEFKRRILDDLRSSKDTLESQMGVKISGIAYPFGQYGQNSINYPEAQAVVSGLTQQIYSYAFYQTNPADGLFYYSPKRDGYMVRRIEPRSKWTGDDLITVLEAGSEKELPFEDSFTQFKGWTKLWGEYVIDGAMTLFTSERNRETFIFLDGAQQWDNYKYEAIVDLHGASTVALVVNMADQEHYQTCSFGNGYARITDRNSGKEHTITKTELGTPESGAVSYVAEVRGVRVTCLVNEAEVISQEIPDKIPTGTVGFKIWDKDGRGYAEIQNITIGSLFNDAY